MSTRTYSLTNTKQLIDLNGDIKNFVLTFSVISKDSKDFYGLVVDQTTLDNETKLEYKTSVDGVIAGEIRSDKDVYQNYYLVLKSDEKREVDVTIEVNEIDVAPSHHPQKQTDNYPLPKQPVSLEKENKDNIIVPKTSSINWKIILIVIVIIGGGFLLYKFYTSKKTSSNEKPVSTFKPVAPISSTITQNTSPSSPQVPLTTTPVIPTNTIPESDTCSSSGITRKSGTSPLDIQNTPGSSEKIDVDITVKQQSPSIIPPISNNSIKSFGFVESKVNKNLLSKLNHININN